MNAPNATEAELRQALERAGRIIDAMAPYIGQMAVDADVLHDLNQHWLWVERDGANARRMARR